MNIPDSEKPFDGILGNSSEIKLLEHLIAAPELDFNISEFSEIVGISRNMVMIGINRFLKWDMIRITKEIGKIKLYSMNEKSELMKMIIEFSNAHLNKLTELEVLEPIKSNVSWVHTDSTKISTEFNESAQEKLEEPIMVLIPGFEEKISGTNLIGFERKNSIPTA